MKPYHAYKPSGIDWIGDIPEGWEVKPLKFSSKVVLGKMLTNEDKGDYQLKPYLRAKNIEWFKPNIEDVKEMWFSENEILQYRIVKGDLLVSEGGEVGRTCIWNEELEECYIQNSVHKVSLFENGNSKYFLNQFILFGQRGHFDAIVNRISIAHLTKEKLMGVVFLNPPLPEQTAIAHYLDRKTSEIDTLIANKQRLIELLKEERTAIINQAVTKGINPNARLKPSGIEWIGDIPEHWEVSRLANIGKFSKGKGVSRADLTEEGVSVILYGDIYTKYNLKTEIVERKTSREIAKDSIQIKKEDLLFTASGETKEDIGKCICYFGNDEVYASGDIVIFRQQGNNSLFLSYVFNSYNIITQKAKMSKGEIVVHIYASQLRNISFALAPIQEQNEIVHFLDQKTTEIDTIISKTEKEIDLMKEYKTALISEVVTGKVDVRE